MAEGKTSLHAGGSQGTERVAEVAKVVFDGRDGARPRGSQGTERVAEVAKVADVETSGAGPAGATPDEASALWGLTPEGDVLVVAAYGALLGKHSERLQVRVKKEVVQEAPLFRLRQVLVVT